jgi:hypothetical protein
MEQSNSAVSQNLTQPNSQGKGTMGCCPGRLLGYGGEFLVSWCMALVVPVILNPIFGDIPGLNNTLKGLFALMTFLTSLGIGFGVSFWVGRQFPVFK